MNPGAIVSSFCHHGGCVQVEFTGSGVYVSSTEAPTDRVWFDRAEWRDFLAGVRNGEFDHPAEES